jgi:chaperonin GroEL
MRARAGGRVVSADVGTKLEQVEMVELGHAQKVVVDRDNTKIIGGLGKKELIEARKSQLRQQIEKTSSDYDRDKLKERLGKLAGGVAVIRIGAPSESEMKSRKEALDDAISSTRAAIAEGIVPGGGLALLRAIDAVEHEEDHQVPSRSGSRRNRETPARISKFPVPLGREFR